MKNVKFKFFSVGLVLAMAFTFSCSGGGGGGGDGDAITYTGTANGVTYTLEIEDGSYTLTQTADTKRSTGTVTKVVGGVLTLAPKEDPDDKFTATVSGNGITAMSGTITWDDGTANIAPNTLTPSGGGGGGGGYTGSYGSVNDAAGKSYKTVQIGTQIWMAENLNYDPGTGNSACYDNQASNCDIYGRLYDWSTALTVCPSGWHLPSDDEWTVLTDYVGGISVGDISPAGIKLKSTSGWNDYEGASGNGTNSYGFSALPGGLGFSGRSFDYVGDYGNWWSASVYDSYAYSRDMANININGHSAVSRAYTLRSNLQSVRCVQNSGGGGGYPGSYGSLPYEGQTYKTVVIGTQTWMAENLNYVVAGSKCYDDDPANCVTYGRLYDWETAKSACPSGWHLPKDAEWTTLRNYAGPFAGTKLRAISGWNDGGFSGGNNSGDGTDDYGFSALPGGFGESGGRFFLNVGYFGSWWSATENDSDRAYSLGIYGGAMDGNFMDKSRLCSVRCVKD